MSANPKAISVRVESAKSGQTAHDLRLGPQPEYVDSTRSALNRVLLKNWSQAELRAHWKATKAATVDTGKIRSNQNLAYAGLITFGIDAQKIFEALTPSQQDAAFHDVAEAVAKRFKTQLTGLVVHVDETAIHAHFQLSGIANDGSMLSQAVKRGALREVQTIAAEAIAKHADGIERGKDRWTRIKVDGEEYAKTLHRTVKQLHEDLPEEIAELEARLTKARSELGTQEARIAKAKAKADAEDDRAAKAQKRAATYEGRAAKLRTEIDELTAALEAKAAAFRTSIEKDRSEAEQTEERLRNLQAEEKAMAARLEALRPAMEALAAHEAAEEARKEREIATAVTTAALPAFEDILDEQGREAVAFAVALTSAAPDHKQRLTAEMSKALQQQPKTPLDMAEMFNHFNAEDRASLREDVNVHSKLSTMDIEAGLEHLRGYPRSRMADAFDVSGESIPRKRLRAVMDQIKAVIVALGEHLGLASWKPTNPPEETKKLSSLPRETQKAVREVLSPNHTSKGLDI